MRSYSAIGDQTAKAGGATPAADSTILGVTSAATVKPKIGYIGVGIAVTEDQQTVLRARRYTAAGTSTAVTPQALDPSDPASLCTAGSNHTAEPTYTSGAFVLTGIFHSRNMFQWWSMPGREITLPATAANGVGVYPEASTSTAALHGIMHWTE